MRDLFSNKNEVNSICGGVGTCTCLNKKGVAAKFVGIVTHDECVKSCEACGYFNQKFVSVVNGMRDINTRFFIARRNLKISLRDTFIVNISR